MKPYSLDLRLRIIDSYVEGGLSKRQLAQKFPVAISFIEKLLKRYTETGSISPKVSKQQTPTKFNQ
ncbi:helix-turn-helix domain-containing protein [Aetokthonos hydrillicola]|nr:helix-turn-helix domain-containing protein [Aetokthonos hydrillicola]